jgi:hypothetical protein
MIQRLFFNSIDVLGYRPSIHQAPKQPASIFPDPAFAPLIVPDQAIVGAQVTLHLLIVLFGVESGFLHGRSLLALCIVH